MAAVSSGFFWNSQGGDRVYDSDSFSSWLEKFFTSGVFTGDLQVTADGSSMDVSVATGYSNVAGKVGYFDTVTSITLETANGVYDRIDNIVVECNYTNREFTIKAVTGTPASSPVAPTLTRDSSAYQLCLAQVTVAAGAVTVSQANITDTRTDSDLCGVVAGTVTEIDFTQITAQFNAYYQQFQADNLESFNDWFDHMKDQLSQDAAGNLQQQIDEINGNTSDWSDATTYAQGDYCIYNKALYMANTVPTVGTFDASEWDKVDLTTLNEKEGGGSMITVVTNDSTLIGETVQITKDGVVVASGVMPDALSVTLSTSVIGDLVITCGGETSNLTIRYYTNYTVDLGTWHFGWYKDKNNSDPATRIGYISGCDNENYTSAYMDYTAGEFNYGDWQDAPFMPRPCMLKSDGTVDYYLDPDDYTKKEDGTASDVDNTSYDGNAMMEWGKFWTYTYEDTDYQYFHISNKQLSANYVCYSNIDANGAEIDHFYTRIYEGSLISSKMRSLSGQTPMNTQSGTNEITYATANNTTATTEWYTGVWADRDLINNLLILLGKSTDTQTVFGNGHYTGGSSASDLIATGTMNNRGLFYGTNGTWAGVKVFGMENWWGNLFERIAGLLQKDGYIYTKKTYDTTDGSTVSGYPTTSITGMVNSGKTVSGTSGGYISVTYANNQGIIPYTASGSSSTYECDGLWWNTSKVGYVAVGGSCIADLLAGAFAVHLSLAVSSFDWAFGASLSCKPVV